MLTSRIVFAAALLGFATASAYAGREPYGQDFQGWTFTQEEAPNGVLCRAEYKKMFVISRHTNGTGGVSMPAGKVKTGDYPDASFEVNRQTKAVRGKADKGRFWLSGIDDTLVNHLVSTKSYTWRVRMPNGQLLDGRVTFDGSVAAAVKRLRECTTSNR